MIARTLVVVLLAAAASGAPASIAAQARASAGDWPQWRVSNRDGIVTSFTEPAAWPEKLTEQWKVTVGLGYATPVLIGNRVFMFARQDANEVMMAIDADTGKVSRQTSYPAQVTMNPAAVRHAEGPKSTPTYADGRLFSLGYGGIVTAWDASNGKILWQKTEFPMATFGTAQSALVDRGLVILHVGGNKSNGALTAFTIVHTGNGVTNALPGLFLDCDSRRGPRACARHTRRAQPRGTEARLVECR